MVLCPEKSRLFHATFVLLLMMWSLQLYSAPGRLIHNRFCGQFDPRIQLRHFLKYLVAHLRHSNLSLLPDRSRSIIFFAVIAAIYRSVSV